MKNNLTFSKWIDLCQFAINCNWLWFCKNGKSKILLKVVLWIKSVWCMSNDFDDWKWFCTVSHDKQLIDNGNMKPTLNVLISLETCFILYRKSPCNTSNTCRMSLFFHVLLRHVTEEDTSSSALHSQFVKIVSDKHTKIWNGCQ